MGYLHLLLNQSLKRKLVFHTLFKYLIEDSMINRAINLIMQNELIGKALQHETFVETILTAVTTSLEAKDALSARYETILKSVGLVTKNQLDELQERLDYLTQEAEGLQEQLDHASQTT